MSTVTDATPALRCTSRRCLEPYSEDNGSGPNRDRCPRCDSPGEQVVVLSLAIAAVADRRNLTSDALVELFGHSPSEGGISFLLAVLGIGGES